MLSQSVFFILMSPLFITACSASSALQLNLEEDLEAEQEYFDSKELQYTDKVYDDNIKTVLVHIKGSELEAPIIPLNGNEKIILRFDDLDDNIREMHYSFVHCTWDWKPSDLQIMDFQEGYNSDIIENYDFSFNTVNNYTNYQLEFPNDRINLKRSGNYIIRVYANGNQDDLMLTSRFMVVEPKVNIGATIRPS
ncbi:MAG: type IX secretion system plug protein domain-containing protein, partial [Cryomorphaceae bacterium]